MRCGLAPFRLLELRRSGAASSPWWRRTRAGCRAHRRHAACVPDAAPRPTSPAGRRLLEIGLGAVEVVFRIDAQADPLAHRRIRARFSTRLWWQPPRCRADRRVPGPRRSPRGRARPRRRRGSRPGTVAARSRGQNVLTQESRFDSRLQIRGGSLEPRRSERGRVAYFEGFVAG